jgi:hypothetical protein
LASEAPELEPQVQFGRRKDAADVTVDPTFSDPVVVVLFDNRSLDNVLGHFCATAASRQPTAALGVRRWV